MSLPRREHRRFAGMIKAREPELRLAKVAEVRHSRGKKLWLLQSILRAAIVGLASGCRGFGELEELTDQMSVPIRRMLRISRRLPDTTARDVIVRLDDTMLRPCIYAQIKAARRRKALDPVGLPFGVVAIDGKVTAIDAWDSRYSQRQRHSEDDGVSGLIRTLSCTLISSRAKVYFDAVPIPPKTNESGAFPLALQSLRDAYGPRLPFEMVVADAAQCIRANDKLVCDTHGLQYLFRLKDSQPTLFREVKKLLGPYGGETSAAESHEVHKPYEEHRQLYISGELAGFDGWEHLRTVLRVERDKIHLQTGKVVHHGTRYFISSLPPEALTPEQWLHLVRCYWGVEQGHNTLDTALGEDERPWVTSDPQGMMAVLLLRRMAHNIMALYRCVTLRSETSHLMPYSRLMSRLRTVLVACTTADLEGLRDRKRAAASLA